MTLDDDLLAALCAEAAPLIALEPPERAARLRGALKEASGVAALAGTGLDHRQQQALLVDQVRLARIRALRDRPGRFQAALAALQAHAGARVAVVSGAGISVDAGFPTFRGADGEGLWEQVDPMELASVDGYRRNPMRTLRWYCWRRSLGLPAVPTLAHAAIARAEERAPARWSGVHTQNVDGLHEAAGSHGVNRIHGSIWCWRDVETNALVFDPSERLEAVEMGADGRPRVRPGVVMFGDYAPVAVYERASRALRSADVAIVVGTSAQVSTLWPLLHAARSARALLVEVNPEPSPVRTELGGIPVELPSGVGIPLALEALGLLGPSDTEQLARTARRPLATVIDSLRDELLADDR